MALGADRIVIGKKHNVVFLVSAHGDIHGWGWSVDNNTRTRTGGFTITQKIPVNRNLESGEPGKLNLHNFVRFDGGNGFHAIPISRVTGSVIHNESQLGYGTGQQSLGCVRLSDAFSAQLYNFARVGMRISAIDRL